MTENKGFEEKPLDSKDYEKEKKTAKWIRGVGVALGAAGSIIVAVVSTLGKNNDGGKA